MESESEPEPDQFAGFRDALVTNPREAQRLLRCAKQTFEDFKKPYDASLLHGEKRYTRLQYTENFRKLGNEYLQMLAIASSTSSTPVSPTTEASSGGQDGGVGEPTKWCCFDCIH